MLYDGRANYRAGPATPEKLGIQNTDTGEWSVATVVLRLFILWCSHLKMIGTSHANASDWDIVRQWKWCQYEHKALMQDVYVGVCPNIDMPGIRACPTGNWVSVGGISS